MKAATALGHSHASHSSHVIFGDNPVDESNKVGLNTSGNLRAKSQSHGNLPLTNPSGIDENPPATVPVNPVTPETPPPAAPRAILFHVISGDQVGEEFLVHADCSVGVMMNFIKRRVTEDKTIPGEAILELFDDNGDSLSLHKSEPLQRGTGFVKHRGVYFPMYYMPENLDSGSEDAISSEGSSTKKDFDSQFDGEVAGESPCEEDDEETNNQVQVLKHPCSSSSGSNTSISTTGSRSIKSLKSHSQAQPHPSMIHDEEEYGEDGNHFHSQHHHHHPKMLHSKLQEFCGEGHEHHHHHHNEPTKSEIVPEDEIHPQEPVKDVLPHDKPKKQEKRNSKSASRPNDGLEFPGEDQEDPVKLLEKTEEPVGNLKTKKEETRPNKELRSDSKASITESAEKKPEKDSKGGSKGDKKRKVKPAKGKKSTPAHVVEFIPPVDDNRKSLVENPPDLPLIAEINETVEMEANEIEPIVEPEPEPEVEVEPDDPRCKVEMEGDKKIIYFPIISESYDDSVKVCKWVVDLHLEIDRGVQEAEIEPVIPDPVPVEQENQDSQSAAGSTGTTKKAKAKGKPKERKEPKEPKEGKKGNKEATGNENSSNVSGNGVGVAL